jgi:quercetin dioxygenase-like cupin family protein
VTLDVAPDGYLLDVDEGEPLWFAGSLLTYKTTGDQTDGHLAVAEVHAPQGAGSPSHRHQREDEAWYILEGELTFWLGDQECTGTAGAFVFGPRGITHRFRVDSAEARFLLFLTPAGFEDFTRACGCPATALTMPGPDLPARDTGSLIVAAKTHGIDILEL